MARNVEIKVEAPHPSRLAARAAELADGPPRTLEQEDLFFHHPQGRLKLRTVADRSRLIYYDRPDQEGPKVSRYVLTPVADSMSKNLTTLLSPATTPSPVSFPSHRVILGGRPR